MADDHFVCDTCGLRMPTEVGRVEDSDCYSKVCSGTMRREKPTTNLDFGQALAAMKDGKMVQRDNERSMVLAIKPVQTGGETISATDGDKWWWAQLGNTSILATDWRVVTEEKA